MNRKVVRVAIRQADETVAVMEFSVINRGSILPSGAEWVDRAAGWWMREANPANIEEDINRAIFVPGQGGYLLGPILGYRVMREDEEAPKRGPYRGAYRDRGGKLEVDMPAARELHRERLRIRRVAKMQELDGEWMRAKGQGKELDAHAVEVKRQALRDLPADPRIDEAGTVEELAALWPKELGRA
jgi:hypothetical protein